MYIVSCITTKKSDKSTDMIVYIFVYESAFLQHTKTRLWKFKTTLLTKENAKMKTFRKMLRFCGRYLSIFTKKSDLLTNSNLSNKLILSIESNP